MNSKPTLKEKLMALFAVFLMLCGESIVEIINK
jgi:hypothetical protein